MRVVFELEAGLRELLQPDKINLASLGNAVPHLHWHVIPRFRGDPHFPSPIWGAPLRQPGAASGTSRRSRKHLRNGSPGSKLLENVSLFRRFAVLFEPWVN